MPHTPPSHSLISERDTLAGLFLGLFAFNAISLALSFMVYFKNNREEADDLAQCIVGSIACAAFVASSILLLSIKPNVYSRHEVAIASCLDATFTLANGVFGILSGVQHLRGTARETSPGIRIANNFLNIINCVYGIYLGRSLNDLRNMLEQLRLSSSGDDVRAAEQGQRTDLEASSQANGRPRRLQRATRPLHSSLNS